MRHNARNLFVLVLVITFACSLFGQKATVPLPKPSGFNMYSIEQEIEVGKQNAAEISKKMPILPDSNPISQYVQHLGQRLIAELPQPTYPFQFHVVQQKEINAFALPGGPVYVNMGTIQACSNEAQLAGVMAHEISHVYMRHSTKQASKEAFAQMGLGAAGAIFGGTMGGQLATYGAQLTAGGVFLKYSRNAESQADQVGAQIMYDAGYDPYQLALFFAKLDEQGLSRGSQFFSDHPNPGNRSQAIRNEIQQFPEKTFMTNTGDFDRIHDLAMGERSYNPQEGPPRGNQGGNRGPSERPSAPDTPSSGNFQKLDHSMFSITYPDNWKVYGDHQSAVTIAPENGIVNNAVAYGVIISGFQQDEGKNLDTATQDLLASLRQSNPDLRALGNGQEITVNNVHGKSLDLVGKSAIDDAQRERDWLVVLPDSNQTLTYAIFIAPDNDFTRYRPTFEKMLRTWHLK